MVNRRLSVTPVARITDGFDQEALLQVARALDEAAKLVDVDLIGGYSALVHGGMTRAATELIHSLPDVLSQTKRVCASVNVATAKAGINMDAVAQMGPRCARSPRPRPMREVSAAPSSSSSPMRRKTIPSWRALSRGGLAGHGDHIGVSGPGVVKSALARLLSADPHCRLNDLAEEIKITSFRVTRVGELIGREVAARLGVAFGIVDLSLAPTPTVGDSVGEILKTLGIDRIGAPGSTAAVAMLNDAVKKGGLFARPAPSADSAAHSSR